MRKVVRIILYIVCIGALCFAGTKLFEYHEETQQSQSSVERLEEIAVKEADSGLPIEVDFAALQAENSEIVAWLYCEDTVINYPVVQAEDNSKYLHSLTDGSYNANGTLFLDYRNTGDFSEFLSVIYGHHMKSGEMFGSLPEYLEEEYYEEHPVMYLFTPEASFELQVVACEIVSADDDIYGLSFENDAEKQATLRKFAAGSAIESRFEYSESDSFLCLSTCSYEYNNARLVVLCKLVSA